MKKIVEGAMEVAQTVPHDPLIHAAGGFAIVTGVISAVGVVFLLLLYVLAFASPYKTLGYAFGLFNDILVAFQYVLAIPIALALYRILRPHNPPLIGAATVVGIVAMVVVAVFQMLLVFEVMPFEKEVLWVTPAMILGVGSWLVITGVVARNAGVFPRSVLMSGIAVPYFGYPVWAFWLGRHLLRW